MENKIVEIHCLQCGAPATFDIISQKYVCGYCGGKVDILASLKEKQDFRLIQRHKLDSSVGNYSLFSTSCSGCGAELVFEENEALTNCAFCGRRLVRSEYLDSSNMPECVIPFGVTIDEAKSLLKDWCEKNHAKPEAKDLLPVIHELKGFYLPYEMVRGPVHMKVGRMDGMRVYECEGFMDNEFVNRSSQLDNLLLDGMEPFDLNPRIENFSTSRTLLMTVC